MGDLRYKGTLEATLLMDPSLLVRRFSVGDLERVLEIERVSFTHPYDAFVFAYYRSRSPEGFLVAEYGGEVVGYIIATPSRTRKEGRLVSVAVDPVFRRRGFGRRLLEEAAAYLRRRGMVRVCLEARVGSDEALGFYGELGFKRDGVIPGYYEDGEDAVVMSRDL